jgi:hypothetical protein
VLATAALISPVPALLGWLGLQHWGWGLYSFWYLITGWIFVLGLIFLLRFRLGPWRQMRVIEPRRIGRADSRLFALRDRPSGRNVQVVHSRSERK